MKYVGSKQRISNQIVPIIQKMIDDNNITTFLDVCVGGGNIIDKINCEHKIGNDNNEYLIAFWKALQNGWHPETDVHMSRELYTDVKNNPGKYDKEVVALCGFCASYNAKWFNGYADITITKTGVKRDYYNEALRNIRKQITNLTDVEFTCYDFEHYNPNGWLIYADIPYKSMIGYKDTFDYERFYNWCRKVSKNNIIIISECTMPDDFKEIWRKEITTTIDHNSRGKRVEKLYVI